MKQDIKNIHHAFVFEGGRDACLQKIFSLVEEKIGISAHHNPDVHVYTYDRFLTKDLEELEECLSQKPFGKEQVFILAFESVVREAQNKLLKHIEEPVACTTIFFIVPSCSVLLDTVRSRMEYGGRFIGTLLYEKEARVFLQGSMKERDAILAPILKEKDRARASHFLDAVEVVLKEGGVQKNASALKELAFVRFYLRDTASSVKMLLEHITVTV